MRTRKKILPGNRENLETIIRAAKNGHLALVSCQRKDTKEYVDVLSAIVLDEQQEYQITPLAMLFNTNPYELLIPPGEEKQ